MIYFKQELDGRVYQSGIVADKSHIPSNCVECTKEEYDNIKNQESMCQDEFGRIIPITLLNIPKELSKKCHLSIISGIDVVLADGTIEHFSLEETDQINLTTAFNAIQSGATSYLYHADGQNYRMYSAEDITTINKMATAHKLYHLTYYHHLIQWYNRAVTIEELELITYGAELPEDLATNMSKLLNNSAIDIS